MPAKRKKPAAKKAQVKKKIRKITTTHKAKAKAKPKKSPVKKKPTIKKGVKRATPKARQSTVMPSRTPLPKIKRTSGSSLNIGLMGISPYQEKAGEEYMNDAQRAHFRQILNLWKVQLMEEVDRTVHHMQDDAVNFPDPNDRATQEEGFNLELRARDRDRRLIKKIEEALQKIEVNEYGYCDICGVEIGIRRLEARPTANLCIDCKTLEEIKERQFSGSTG